MKIDRLTEMRMPMSRTLFARSVYSASSRSGTPKSLTSSAPATLNRSVIRVPMSALRFICREARPARRRPMTRAGMMNSGTSSSEPRVSCHDRAIIAPTMSTTETMLLTTLDSTEVKACCAPMTSLLSRDTSEPVWARVKKAMGWRRTCPNTSLRRSLMRPSPIFEEYHREITVMSASATAMAATSRASLTTTPLSCGMTPRSTISLSSSGIATTSAESSTVTTRNAMIERRYGPA